MIFSSMAAVRKRQIYIYCLARLQHDRSNTLNDPEYLTFFDSFDATSLSEGAKDDLPYLRLVIAYTHFVRGSHDEAQKQLDLVKANLPAKETRSPHHLYSSPGKLYG